MSGAALRVYDLPMRGEPVRHLRLVPQEQPTYEQLHFVLDQAEAPVPSAAPSRDPNFAGLPDIDAWVRQLTVGLIEVLMGARHVHQLVRWLDPAVYNAVASHRHTEQGAHRELHPHVSTVHAQSPRRGIVEATAVVRLGGRYRALALRLRADEGRWKCAELQVV